MDLEEKNGGFVPGREKGRRFLIEQGKEGSRGIYSLFFSKKVMKDRERDLWQEKR